jgi:predicted permease
MPGERPDGVMVGLLVRLVPPAEREDIVGDLRERFERERIALGERTARRRLRRALRSVAVAYLTARLVPGRLREAAAVRAARRRRRDPASPLLETPGREVRQALRALRRSPLYTTTVIGCLALGLGLTTAVLTIFYGIMLRPLPFTDPDRLVVLFLNGPGVTRVGPSYADLLDWRRLSRSFEDLELYRGTEMMLRGLDQAERLAGTVATPGLFRLLGVRPALGRDFDPADGEPGAPGTVVLSHRVWSTRLGGDPAAVGRTVVLDEETYTIVGIMPPGFHFEAAADFWLPPRTSPGLSRKSRYYAAAIGRLRPGVTTDQVRREMNTLAARLASEYPETNAEMGVVVRSLAEDLLGSSRTPVTVFFGAVCFLLLLSCANAAHLMLGRAATRRRELAVRSALGSGRRRLLGLLLTESVVLAAAASGLGLVVGVLLRDLYLASLPEQVPYYLDFSLDPQVVLVLAALTLLTAVLFGLAPAAFFLSGDPSRHLREGNGTLTDRPGRLLPRALLIATESALTLIVLVGAGLMLKSLANLRSVAPGFDPKNVLTMELEFPDHHPETSEQVIALFESVPARVAALPGIVSASAVSNLPMGRSQWQGAISFEPAEGEPAREISWAVGSAVLKGYFRLMHIPVLAGRPFDDRDVGGGPEVVVVNESLARHCWPEGDWLGRRIKYGPADSEWPWMDVVGTTGDLHHYGLDYPVSYGYFRPHAQVGFRKMTLVVRTRSEPLRSAGAVRAAIREIDPELAVWDVRSMEQVIAANHWEAIAYSRLSGVFSLLALLLAALGIYGIVSYSVAQRTRELGLRLALGARPGQLIGLLMRRVVVPTGLGLAVGLALALLLMRGLSGLLFGVVWDDPPVYLAAAVVMAAIALPAGYLPARSAGRIDPVRALRGE